jgi:amidase
MNELRVHYEDPVKRRQLKPEIVWEIEAGADISSRDITAAAVTRSDWHWELMRLFDTHDFLVLPAAQVFPFPADVHWPASIDGREMDTYHRWMEVVIGGTLGGLPVAALPAGFDPHGRPMGIQVLGPAGQDVKVLEFALAYEAITDHLEHGPALGP